MRFLPKSPQRSWEKSAFGAFGREILRPKRSSRISSRVSGRLGGRGRAMGGNRRGRIPRGAGLGRHCGKAFPDIAKTTFFHIAKTAFPSLATRVEKPSTKNPRGAFPMTTVPGVSAARFAQKRSQMSMALCAKCAGKPRKAGRNPPEIAG